MLRRPRTNEYHPFFERYITLVPNEGLLDILKKQQDILLPKITHSMLCKMMNIISTKADKLHSFLGYHILLMVPIDVFLFSQRFLNHNHSEIL